MSTPTIETLIFEKVKSFNANCEKQYQDIAEKEEQQRREEQERERHLEDLKKKFESTILKDLQLFFYSIKPALSSPYLEFLLDTHIQRKRFFLYDKPDTPAYAFLALDARSKIHEETFECARYLLFAISPSGSSFELMLENEGRDVLRAGENEDIDTTFLQSYPLDEYNFDDIRKHIEKYLMEELTYFQEHFRIDVDDPDDF